MGLDLDYYDYYYHCYLLFTVCLHYWDYHSHCIYFYAFYAFSLSLFVSSVICSCYNVVVFCLFIGLIRDYSNYVVTLHIINGLCLLAVAMWLLEIIAKKCKPLTN